MRALLITALTVATCPIAPVACVGYDPVQSSVDGGRDGALDPDGAAVDASDATNGVDGPGSPSCNRIHVTTLTGTGAGGFMDGPGPSARFDLAEGITVDPGGVLFVADYNNARVRKVVADGTTSTFASGMNILSARRVARHPGGDFYLADTANNALTQITAAGMVAKIVPISDGITSVGVNPAGAIYVAVSPKCLIQTVNGDAVTPFSGGACGFRDGPKATAQYQSGISDLAFDGNGNLYVLDQGNFRIRRVDADGAASTLAGAVQGYADGVGSAAQFQAPTALAVNEAKHLVYVADGATIRVVATNGTVSTLVGSTPGFMDGDGCTAQFRSLHGIAYFAGALYAVDDNRVRKVSLP